MAIKKSIKNIIKKAKRFKFGKKVIFKHKGKSRKGRLFGKTLFSLPLDVAYNHNKYEIFKLKNGYAVSKKMKIKKSKVRKK